MPKLTARLRFIVGAMALALIVALAAPATAQQRAYGCISCLNRRHMLWAWTSLCSVMFADVYVRLCSMGVWRDMRIF